VIDEVGGDCITIAVMRYCNVGLQWFLVHKVDIFGFSDGLDGVWYNQRLYIVVYRQRHYPTPVTERET
jgi:hypothetical protein